MTINCIWIQSNGILIPKPLGFFSDVRLPTGSHNIRNRETIVYLMSFGKKVLLIRKLIFFNYISWPIGTLARLNVFELGPVK